MNFKKTISDIAFIADELANIRDIIGGFIIHRSS